jgi:hypothetical protein
MRRLLILLSCSLAMTLHAQSTISEDDRYAWAHNLGWVDLRSDRPSPGDGVRVTDAQLSGYAWSATVGWIHFGNGAPTNGLKYANLHSADYGVNHDGAGNLSGLAWAPNIGWINFGWAKVSNPDRPRFDLYSGHFAGYAWSANCGWINLGSGLLRTESIAISDSDHDGISDTWEQQQAGNLTDLTESGDADGDGISDRSEYVMDSNPLEPNEGVRIVGLSLIAARQWAQLEWTSRPTRVYQILESTNLATQVWTPIGTVAGAPAPTTLAEVFAAKDSAFYRVEAKLPLVP